MTASSNYFWFIYAVSEGSIPRPMATVAFGCNAIWT